MEIYVGLVSVLVLLLSYLWIKRWQERRQYPDGPPSLPIVGNMLQLLLVGGNMVKFLEKYRKIYGNVYTVELAGTYRVVISGQELLHNVFIKNADVTSSRTPATMEPVIDARARKTPGIIWAPTPKWKEMRSFVLNFLRAEGMGKLSLEPKILEEIQEYKRAFIEPNIGKPFNIEESLNYAVSNIINSMAFGARFDYKDPTFIELMGKIKESVALSLRVALTKTIPLIKYLPGDLSGAKRNAEFDDYLTRTMQAFIDEHKATLDRENPGSYIDHYLIHSEKELEKNPDSVFNEGNLLVTVIQLFVAGSETTTTALRWALLFMCKRPDVQTRVREEIDQQIGCDRLPSYKDRLHMPYTEAVLAETLRLGNIAPTSLPHTLSKEMTIDGKLVPAGAELMMNMASALSDEKVFDKPDIFNPDKFLNDPSLVKSKNFVPFSLGRRVCIGEGLARMELFLTFTSLLQAYTVSLPEGKVVSTEGIVGLTNTPQSYQIIFEKR